MQVSHQYKAAVQAPPHHHQADPAVAAGEATGELLAPVLILAFVGFCGFVVFRFWRWFFRVTR